MVALPSFLPSYFEKPYQHRSEHVLAPINTSLIHELSPEVENMEEIWAGLGSFIASAMFLWTMLSQYFPSQYFGKHTTKLISLVYPYVQISIPEYTGKHMRRSEAYSAVAAYLTASCTQSANKLTAVVGKDTSNLLLSMGANEKVEDTFLGAQLWWTSNESIPKTQVLSFYPAPQERRSYNLTFHKSHRGLVIDSYLAHVMKEGREIAVRNRQRKLYTNNPRTDDDYNGAWSHIVFEHPASFDKLAMDPVKKLDIMEDLDAFRKGKEYYARIGKAWKRGYLLFGPPGTGKSTMIAAMANYMDYDIYDIELTIVKTNTDLRKLLIETTSKSIIVLEDIDCSLDLTGKRKKKPKTEKEDESKKLLKGEEKDETSKVTLSGLLNFIDGLWSACGGERIIIFTTNHVEKLDPALIRRGRMDKHIEMGYCGFEAFKVLAHNYLDLDSHPLFDIIERMMGEIKITPADVAENLMPKSLKEDAETCLANLIQALEKAKEEEQASINANHQEGEMGEILEIC